MKRIEPWHWALLAAAAAAVFLWTRHDGITGKLGQPQYQPQPIDDMSRLTDSGVPHCHPEQFHAGYFYTPHRYPRVAGGEITAVIHKGFSTMRVPQVPDVQWIIAPPSEVMW